MVVLHFCCWQPGTDYTWGRAAAHFLSCLILQQETLPAPFCLPSQPTCKQEPSRLSCMLQQLHRCCSDGDCQQLADLTAHLLASCVSGLPGAACVCSGLTAMQAQPPIASVVTVAPDTDVPGASCLQAWHLRCFAQLPDCAA